MTKAEARKEELLVLQKNANKALAKYVNSPKMHNMALKAYDAVLEELIITERKLLFEKIAQDNMGIETLERRGRDSLDFHDVSVTSILDALQEAYEAGYAQAKDDCGE